MARKVARNAVIDFLARKGDGRRLKFLVRCGVPTLAPTVGLLAGLLAVLRHGGPPGRMVRLITTRQDLLVHAIFTGVGGYQVGAESSLLRKLAQAAKHFGEVDVHKLYSVPVRAAAVVVALLNDCDDPAASHGAVESKKVFGERCEALGLPHVPDLSAAEVRARLGAGVALIAKPVDGVVGQGIRLLTDARDPTLDEVLSAAYVVQDVVANAAELEEYLAPDPPLCTLRIATFRRHDGALDVLEAWLRAGGSGALVDHVISEEGSAESRAFIVHAETGVVWRGSSFEGAMEASIDEPSLLRAAGAQKNLAGLRLPHWDEAVAVARKAHAELVPAAFSVGWDVALTDAGPVLLEANLIHHTGIPYGMRWGTQCRLWPASATFWVSLAKFLRGKERWFQLDDKQLVEPIEAEVAKAQWLLQRAERRAAKHAARRTAAQAKAGDAGLCEKRMEELVCEGECAGLRAEVAAFQAWLAELQPAAAPAGR